MNGLQTYITVVGTITATLTMLGLAAASFGKSRRWARNKISSTIGNAVQLELSSEHALEHFESLKNDHKELRDTMSQGFGKVHGRIDVLHRDLSEVREIVAYNQGYIEAQQKARQITQVEEIHEAVVED